MASPWACLLSFSHAIDWVPEHGKAMMDNVLDTARVGRYLLSDPHAPQEGF
jgi:hypothetical protein